MLYPICSPKYLIIWLGLAALVFRAAAAPPAWWAQRAVTTGAAADDYRYLNQGQLKHLATQAYHEMEARLAGGAGPQLAGLVGSWLNPPPQTDDYAALNRGQLKNVARLFFDRLAEVGYGDAPVVAGRRYPWTLTSTDDDDFAYATIGLAKQLFSFDLAQDSDSDGLPDWWERSQGLQPDNPADAAGDPDGDGLSNLQEFLAGRNAHVPDPDVAGQLLVASPAQVDVLLDPNRSTTRNARLLNLSGAAIDYVLDRGSAATSYAWLASYHAGGPAYVWNDISGSGTRLNTISGADNANESIADIGFPFPFYSSHYSSAWVTSNGYLTLSTSGSTQGANYPLPSNSMPALLIAPFFDDLIAGEVHYEKEPGKLTVQFSNASRYGGTGSYTFQVVLQASGAITFFYHTMTGVIYSATIGIQDGSNPRQGLQVAYNNSFVQNGTAVQIFPWLMAAPAAGSLAPNQRLDVALTYVAGPVEGTRNASIALKNGAGTVVGPPLQTSLTVSSDFDGDGLSNQDEAAYGFDPFNADSDGDGILDGLAQMLGLAADDLDSDGDGISNAQEIRNGTNPFSADSDGDGVPDRLDPLPLDPSVSSLPGGVSGAPILALLAPPGAVPVP
jgi:hypothetical protein